VLTLESNVTSIRGRRPLQWRCYGESVAGSRATSAGRSWQHL